MPSPAVLIRRPLFLAIAGVDQLEAMGPEARVRARLVGFHQPAVADHVGGEDGCQAAFDCAAVHEVNVASDRGDDKRAEAVNCMAPNALWRARARSGR
jgi:hypothetical protein